MAKKIGIVYCERIQDTSCPIERGRRDRSDAEQVRGARAYGNPRLLISLRSISSRMMNDECGMMKHIAPSLRQ